MSQQEIFTDRDIYIFNQVFFKVNWWGIKSTEEIFESEEKKKYLVDVAWRLAVLLLSIPTWLRHKENEMFWGKYWNEILGVL